MITAVVVFWNTMLEPTTLIAMVPLAQALVAVALAALGALVGWGRGLLDRLRRAVGELEEREQARLENLEAAYAIQQSLLPQRLPDTPGITWAWVCEPSEEVGGDKLSYTQLSPDRLALYLLDVSGQGLAAAMFSDTLVRLIPVLWRRSPELGPAELLTELNREFPMNPVTGQYFTIVCAVLDPAARVLACATAGNPGPAWFRTGERPRRLELPGPPVRLTADASFEQAWVELAPGDRMVFFSDGVTEALDPQMRPYGAERMLQVLSVDAPVAGALDAVLQDVKEHIAGGTQDDLAMLGLQLDKY